MTEKPLEKRSHGAGLTEPDGAIRALIFLIVVSIFNYMDRMILAILLQPIKIALQLSDTQLGLLTGFAFALFYAAFGLPMAWIADRVPRVAFIAVTMTLWSAMTAATGLAQNFAQMLIARMGVGIGEAGCVPTSHSLLADYFPGRRRIFAIGLFQAGAGVGMLLGSALAGFLATRIGWRETFFVIGAAGAIVAPFVYRGVADIPRTGIVKQETPDIRVSLKLLLQRRSYVHIVIAYGAAMFASYAIIQWAPSFFVRTHGLSLDVIGLALGVAFGFGTIAGMVSGSVMASRLAGRDRRWEVWAPGVAVAVSFPAYLGVFLTPDPNVAFVFLFAGCFFSATALGPGLACIQSVCGPHLRATAVAIVMFVSAVMGQGTGPFFAGALSQALASQLHADALGAALACMTLAFLWSTFHFWRAGRSFLADLAD